MTTTMISLSIKAVVMTMMIGDDDGGGGGGGCAEHWLKTQ